MTTSWPTLPVRYFIQGTRDYISELHCLSRTVLSRNCPFSHRNSHFDNTSITPPNLSMPERITLYSAKVCSNAYCPSWHGKTH